MRKTRQGWMVLVLACAAAPLAARAQKLPPSPVTYSATMVIHSQGRTVTERIERDHDKLRAAMNAPGQAAGMYTIMLLAQHKSFMVMPQEHMCMAMPLNPALDPLNWEKQMRHSISVTDLGAGHANGHPAEIKRVVYTDASGQHWTSRIWLATDLRYMPLRIVGRDDKGHALRVDWTNISLAAPPASRFQPPAHCRAMPMAPGPPHP